MKILLLSTLSVPVLAYDQEPKIVGVKTILHKLDNIAFKGTNLSVRGLNDLDLTHKLAETKNISFEGYGRYNLSRRNSESGMHIKMKW